VSETVGIITGQGFVYVTVDDSGIQQLTVPRCFYSKVRVAVCASFCRPVENLPVNQTAVARETNAARTDSAERELDFLKGCSGKYCSFHVISPFRK